VRQVQSTSLLPSSAIRRVENTALTQQMPVALRNKNAISQFAQRAVSTFGLQREVGNFPHIAWRIGNNGGKPAGLKAKDVDQVIAKEDGFFRADACFRHELARRGSFIPHRGAHQLDAEITDAFGKGSAGTA